MNSGTPGLTAQRETKMTAEEQKLFTELANDYQNLRLLDDGTIIGTYRLLYTHALYIGLNTWGWERRYCYPTEHLAIEACKNLVSGDTEPIKGYIASR